MGAAICDYFCISTARDDGLELLDNLRPVIEAAGGSDQGPHLFEFPSGGTIKHHARGQVYVVGVSGAALAHFRGLDLFDRYLWGIVESPPHRVTQMHATMDFAEHAPPVVRRLFSRASKGGIHLTRKAIKAKDVNKYFGVNDDGEETGTVYLGNRRQDVWAKVYDKRHERLCRGYADPGPMLRVEVSISGKMGISLRDVSEPDAVFYHFASPGLVAAPPGAPVWEPGGSALKLPPKVALLPAQRLMRLLSGSPDIRRALELAEQIGPHGKDFLYRKLDQMCSQAACAAVGAPA
ncbi:MAG: hypothetical protein WAL92_18245 [Thiogranum sp.]